MAIDLQKLKPGEVVRIMNSTPLGTVVSDLQFKRNRESAGFLIGDTKVTDLIKYIAWLASQHDRRPPQPDLTPYEVHKDRMRKRMVALSESGRNIGDLSPVVDKARKDACRHNLQLYCEVYYPQTFTLAWSPDHIKVIKKIELAVLEGGLFAIAMPRGSGKTTMCEIACIWALTYGHCLFVALIGTDEEHAENMLDSIKVELETNDALLDDFPEICYPIRALEGIHQRAGGQLFQGELTHIGWTASEIILPTIPDSVASGAIVKVAGITGRIRGMKHKRADGSSIRPSLTLIDDPQTDESARSPSQCANRERVLSGAILGLAGPGQKIAGLMTLTVVRPDDLADRILDREKHPQWQGERTKMIYAFPKNENLWSRHEQLWREGLNAGRGTKEAHKFYADNQEAMDEGSKVAWPERHYSTELTALEHAMNIKLDRGEPAFWAEYQNEPLPEDRAEEDQLTADQIIAKTNGHKRGEVPLSCNLLTMFIDIQAKVLYWVMVGWENDFTGYVVDYGTEPDQKVAYFSLGDIRRTLAVSSPRAGREGAILAGLGRLAERTLGREWPREGGGTVRIDRCLIDANWGETTNLIYQFCRQSNHAAILIPSHGRYVGASSIPFTDYKKKRGDRLGMNWRIPALIGHRTIRHVTYDTNYWKSFVHARLAVPMGDPGCMSLFGHKPETHRLFGEHLTSEYRVLTIGRGRSCDEWKIRLSSRDNHWFDGVVGTAVAASLQGAFLPEIGPQTRASRRPQVSMREMASAARNRQAM